MRTFTVTVSLPESGEYDTLTMDECLHIEHVLNDTFAGIDKLVAALHVEQQRVEQARQRHTPRDRAPEDYWRETYGFGGGTHE